MAGGKVYHWKHGWIPLTRAALMSKLGKGPPPRGNSKGGALTAADRARITAMIRSQKPDKPPNWVPPKDNVPRWKPSSAADAKKLIREELAKDKSMAEIRREARRAAGRAEQDELDRIAQKYGTASDEYRKAVKAYVKPDMDYFRKREVAEQALIKKSAAELRRAQYQDEVDMDGVKFVTYRDASADPLGDEHGRPAALTGEQMQTLASAYNEIKAEFPTMLPVQIVAVDEKSEAFGITTWDGRRISMSTRTFSDKARLGAKANWGDHGAIAGQFVDDPEAFARAVMVHEMGHALQMQNGTLLRDGQKIAEELVDLVDTDKGVRPRPAETPEPGSFAVLPSHRWMVDTLDRQSAYATGNKFEWFAEAFADGWFNGENATDSGKRALELAKQAYATKETKAA